MQARIFKVEEVADMLLCNVTTVEDQARRGVLPGLKMGRSWVFPSGALFTALDEIAAENRKARTKPCDVPMTTADLPVTRRGRKRNAQPLSS